jgi:hypothetical protein
MNNKLLNPLDQWSIIKTLSKVFTVKCVIGPAKMNCSARVDMETEIITFDMSIERSENQLISVFLHELCHLKAKRDGKFKIYHDFKIGHMTKKDWTVYKQTALRAEKYVDREAHKICSKMFPKIDFVYSYKDKKVIREFSQEVNELVNGFIKNLD